MSFQLRFNHRTWALEIGAVGDLMWSTIADGGFERVTWKMPLPDTFSHPSVYAGALVELMVGPWSLGASILRKPVLTSDGWEFLAIGLYDPLYSGYLCLDSGGNTTSIPDVAVDQAIADGFPVTRPESLMSVPFTANEQTDDLNYVAELLNPAMTELGKRWRINPDRTITASVDPAFPDWFLLPGGDPLETADDVYVSDLYLRYRPSSTSYATVHVPSGRTPRVAAKVDLTSLGPIPGTKATDIGNGLMAKGAARFAATGALTPSRYRLVTRGGQPAYLPKVRGGQKVRQFGMRDPQNPTLGYYDWVIGRTELVAGANQIQLTPVELASRSLGDILSLGTVA